MDDDLKFPFCVTCVYREYDCEECELGELYEVDEDLIVPDGEGRMTLNKQLMVA